MVIGDLGGSATLVGAVLARARACGHDRVYAASPRATAASLASGSPFTSGAELP